MKPTRIDPKYVEELEQDRETYFNLIIQLVDSNATERNRILDSLKSAKVKRAVGRPKKYSDKSLDEFLSSFEFIKSEGNKKIVDAQNAVAKGCATVEEKLIGQVGTLTDSKVLAMPQLLALEATDKRLSKVQKDEQLVKSRKTIKNKLAQARKSRKLIK